jgi:ATP-dependent RNA helicase RhlE
MENAPTSSSGFVGLGIAPKILEILTHLKYVKPTPIQAQAIPHALEGKDVMGIAQTGTGKTLAFGIPMIQRLAQSKAKGLIILPTRELAVQVNESLQNLGKSLGLKTSVLIGGESMHKQLTSLRRDPHVIIATPGRLIDHLQHRSVDLQRVSILVLDEADRMLDMGFAPQIKQILQSVPKVRQTMLFSATMPSEIVHIATAYMQLPIRVEVAPAGTASAQVTQEVFFVHRENKLQLLESVLKEHRGSILVFSRTKFGAKKIAQVVRNMGHSASEIHSNRSLNQRLEALEGFKRGKYRVLVATDIAARGIDVSGIEVVINYDIPENPEDYVHRIGRTGRAALSGKAISFATPEQKRDVRDIERLIRMALPVGKLPVHLEKASASPVRSSSPYSSRTDSARPTRSSSSRSRSKLNAPQRAGGTKIFWGSTSNAGYAERKHGQSQFHRDRQYGNKPKGR